MHLNKFRGDRGLAFWPALILFVIVVIFTTTAVIMIAKAAQKILNPNPPPYEGPTTNTPPDSTFTIPYEEVSPMWEQLEANNNVGAETRAAFDAVMADTNAEFQIVMLRSFDLVNWVEVARTNTVGKQITWYEHLPDTNTAIFYRPLVVLP